MKTNHRMLGGLAAAALVVATGSNAFGAMMITITGDSRYRAGDGGEFNVRPANNEGASLLAPNLTGYLVNNGTTVGTATGTRMYTTSYGVAGFETFCIEHNEYITLPGTYTASISLGAVYGGVAGGIDPDGTGPLPKTDLISVGTAFLYQQFATGTLAGYNYTPGTNRANSARNLQNAIWFLEDEISLTASQIAANTFLQLAFSTYGTPVAGIGNAAGGAKANNTVWNVAALNLGGVAPNQKQDQLILHDNGFSVPDGGTTLALLGIALGGLSYARRKWA